MSGPAWLGIGAQRSGTTWFTDLLLQHPDVTLAAPARKELHWLYRGLTGPVDDAAYLGLFEADGRAGECTPAYLRCIWAAEMAARLVAPDTPVFVLLRDPVERFASAMRLDTSRARLATPKQLRTLGPDAIWAGMYATQLEAWERWLANGQLMVLQYEQVIRDPGAHVELVWARMGLDPVALSGADIPSATSTTGHAWEWPTGLKETLISSYRPQVKALSRWGVRADLWPNFRGDS